MSEELKNKLLANMYDTSTINEYMKYLESQKLREKLFDNPKTRALKARKRARRVVK